MSGSEAGLRGNKRADSEAPMIDLLAERFSPRSFADTDVGDDALRSLFSAAAWAPSCGNEQPWRFVVGRRPEPTWQAMFAVLNERNRRWAGSAPILGLIIAKISEGGAPLPTGSYDAGQAIATLTVQASAMQIHVHQMAGFDLGATRRRFAIPVDFLPVAVFSIGHLGDPEDLPPDLRTRERAPRGRRPLAETVFEDTFGNAASWVAAP